MGHDYETLSRLHIVAEEIAGIHDARIDKHEMDDGLWVVSIETDEAAVRGEGYSEAQAFGDLIANAKAEGWATK